MKKNLLLPALLFAAGVFTVPAHAESPYYISGNVGISSFNNIEILIPATDIVEGTATTSAGIDLTGAAGRSFGDFRVEAEIGYQRNNADTYIFSQGVVPLTGNFSVTSFLINSYYDFKTDGITPYLSAGLGLAGVTLHKIPDPPETVTESHAALGYQFGAGIAIPLSKTIDLDARYRYFGTSKVTLSDSHGRLDIHGSDFLLGLRVKL